MTEELNGAAGGDGGQQETWQARVVKNLYALANDRGALAQLRRGRGREPQEAVHAARRVAYTRLGGFPRTKDEPVMLAAVLFAGHPHAARRGNLGAALRARGRDAAADNALNRAVDAHIDDLPSRLQAAVSLVDGALDWERLLYDLCDLYGTDQQRADKVRVEWAREYYAEAAPSK